MSQDLFSFQKLFIGLLQLSSSNQGGDPKVIARLICQITGLKYCYVLAGKSDSIASSKKVKEIGMRPELSCPPVLSTSQNIPIQRQSLSSFNNIIQGEINPCDYILLMFQKDGGNSKQANQD
jgi:hypothetical protein